MNVVFGADGGEDVPNLVKDQFDRGGRTRLKEKVHTGRAPLRRLVGKSGVKVYVNKASLPPLFFFSLFDLISASHLLNADPTFSWPEMGEERLNTQLDLR